MKSFCHCICSIFLLIVAFATASAALDSRASVSGVVRDDKRLPLAGASLTLQGHDPATLLYQATSDPYGAFLFPAVAVGEYTLLAAHGGYAPPAPITLHVGSSPVAVTIDLLPIASAPPQFQSSGIRGLIDPGGYSASSDGAASDLLRGMAQLKHADGQPVAAPGQAVACSAEPTLREAVAAHPDAAAPHLQLGQFYALHDQPSAALPLLRRALQLDPENIVAARDLAMLLLQTGQFHQARSLLEPFAANASQPEVHQLLARADEGDGLFPQAARQYQLANQEDPGPQNAFGLGYELLLSGARTDASAAFQEGAQRNPQSIPLRLGVGITQMLSGNTAAALDSFLAAVDLNPRDLRPYPFVVNAFQASGRESERVRASLRQLVLLAPDNADALSMDATVLSTTGGSSEQIESLLKRAIALDPTLAAAHLQLAQQYAQQADYASAIPEYETAINLNRTFTGAHYRLALAYRRTGQIEKSKLEMQKFRSAEGGNPAGQTATGPSTSLAQLLAAMRSGPSQSTPDTRCPASPPRTPTQP